LKGSDLKKGAQIERDLRRVRGELRRAPRGLAVAVVVVDVVAGHR